jgi:glycosyltransferase involved in cell wall biosynthesis
MQEIWPSSFHYVHERNIGLHHCRHTGAKIARGDILLFIDDDVFLSSNWLEAHLDAHSDLNTWAVGGRVMPHWEVDPPDWVRKMPKDYLSLLDYGANSRPIRKNEGINGCNYSIKKIHLFELGGFHPDSFSDTNRLWYRGDGEAGLTKKILAAGGTVIYEPKALLEHRIPAKRLTTEYFVHRGRMHGIENAYSILRRYKCSPWISSALMIGGGIRSAYHKVGSKSLLNLENRICHEVASSRFWAIAQYGWRVLNDTQLRKHILRTNYLD